MPKWARSITNNEVEKMPVPEFKFGPTGNKISSQVIYFDPVDRWFGVRVTSSGKKAFIAEKWQNNKPVRITIGGVDIFTAQQARKLAQGKIGEISQGTNPNEEKREKRVKGVTLGEAFKEYLKARKDLKPRTIADYTIFFEKKHLADWINKPLTDITKDVVAKRHAELGKKSPAQANQAMRALRAVFNFAIVKYEPVVTTNPVSALSKTRAWFDVKRRKTYVKNEDLAAWFKGLDALTYQASADYFRLVILSGLRLTEAASIQWQFVDLKNKTFTIPDTKNHDDHVLPMSDYLVELFERRHAANEEAKRKGHGSDYVFPGKGTGSHITTPNTAVEAVIAASGIEFTTHDLRRTFATVADRLDLSAYAIKRLVNHREKSDVTAGYIIKDVERLREPMQKITDFILDQAGVKKASIAANQDDAPKKAKQPKAKSEAKASPPPAMPGQLGLF